MDQLPEIRQPAPRRKEEEEKKKAGVAWFFDAGKTAEGLATGGEGGLSSLGRLWAQALRWLAQGGSIFATAKGRMLMTLLACAIATLTNWFYANAQGAPSLGRPPLFNGGGPRGKAWQEPDLWNTDLSKTPNSVNLVAGGNEIDPAARAAAPAPNIGAGTKNEGGAGDAGGPGAMGGAKDAGGANLPDGKALPNGPDQLSSRDARLGKTLGQMKPWQPPASAVGSSAALFGGVGRAFSAIKTLALKPFSGQSAAQRATTPRAAVSGGRGFGPARRALNQAFGFGKLSRATGDLGAASTYSGAVFDNSQPAGTAVTGGGSAIEGNGIAAGQGAKGDEYSQGGPTGGGSPGGTSSGPNTTTGPSSAQANCDAMFPDGGMLATPEGGCAPAANAQNATPWQGQSDMAMMLTLIAGIVLLVAEILSQFTYTKPLAFWLAAIAAVLGAMVVMMGVMVMSQGQQSQGLIYTLTGAMITAAGVMCAMGAKKADAPKTLMSGDSTDAQGPIARGAGITNA